MTIKNGSTIEGNIEAVAFGGDGLLRHEGQVVFIPFAVVGDKIKARITQSKKNFAKAKILQVLTDSPARVTPPCPVFGVCGGCQMQNTAYEQQLETKRLFVVDALERIGKLGGVKVEPTVGAEAQWQYRRHVRLHFSGPQVGYFRSQSAELIATDECPIFLSSESPVFKDLRKSIFALNEKMPGISGDITIFKGRTGPVVGLILPNTSVDPETVLNFIAAPNIQGLWCQVSDERVAKRGDCTLQFELNGLSFFYSPTAFVQAHPEQSAKLYQNLLAQILSDIPAKVLDLYSGIGVMSLLLRREGPQVSSIEGSPEAVRLAQQNAKNNQLEDINFSKGNVDELLPQTLKSFKPSTVILNPPRTGVNPPALKALIDQPAETLFYISCMPSTLARDLSALTAAGYRVSHCQPYDLFPQTTHVETCVKLVRAK